MKRKRGEYYNNHQKNPHKRKSIRRTEQSNYHLNYSRDNYYSKPYSSNFSKPRFKKKDYRRKPIDDKDGHYIFTYNDILHQRYVLKRYIGDGTFSKVYESYDLKTKKYVAIKIIKSKPPKYKKAGEIEIKILRYINKRCRNSFCIKLCDHFVHFNHVCLVFPVFGGSLYKFLNDNNNMGYPIQHVQDIGYQLSCAIRDVHQIGLTHTGLFLVFFLNFKIDLKPENILLVDSSYFVQTDGKRILKNSNIRLTDFGSAVFSDDIRRHSSLIQTRHYRAPEVILGMKWNFPADIFSLGCIIFELFTGETLFTTHEDIEHLAIMEHYVGKMPKKFINKITNDETKKKYFRNGRFDWPRVASSYESFKYVKSLKSLDGLVYRKRYHNGSLLLLDLVRNLLCFDPSERPNINQVLSHRFFYRG